MKMSSVIIIKENWYWAALSIIFGLISGTLPPILKLPVFIIALFFLALFLWLLISRSIEHTQKALDDRIKKFEELFKKLGIPSEPYIKMVNYDFDIERGTITKGNIRNMIVRCSTFNEIMKGIRDVDNDGSLIEKIGIGIGKSFATDFNREIELKRSKGEETISSKDVLGLLKLASIYDQSAGWGKIDYSKLDTNYSGKIVIEHCFIMEDGDNIEYMCKFVRGYLKGLLVKMFNLDENRLVIEGCGNCELHRGVRTCIFSSRY